MGGIFLLIHGGNLNDFYLDRNLIFCVSVSFTSTMLNFLIIALVIYKSAIAAGNDDASSDRQGSVSLIAGIKGQYLLER